MKIAVHPLSNNPTDAWQQLSQQQKVVKIISKTPTTEIPKDKVRQSEELVFFKTFINSNKLCIAAPSCLYERHTFLDTVY